MNPTERPALILTPPVPIENFELFVSAIHQWNLYDFYCRGLRYTESAGGDATVELDLFLPGRMVRVSEKSDPVTEIETGFRFQGVDVVEIANFTPPYSVIIGYEFRMQDAANPGGPTIYVQIDFIGGQLQLLCQTIAVSHVREHLISP